MERGLTLGQLAKLSGISKAILSDIEKGGSNPTINTIWKIANGLNIPFTRLMEFEEPAGTVVRKADTAMQHGDTEAYRIYCYFASAPERNFELKANFPLKRTPRCIRWARAIRWCSIPALTIPILTIKT